MEREARSGGHPTAAFVARLHAEWLRDMCDAVGVEPPAAEAAERLALDAARYITTRIPPATFDGVARALETLRARGYALHTAAGPWSADLEDYLTAMGVRALVGKTYGPDLVGAWKHWAQRDFYGAILADLGASADRAIVVDDHVRHLDAAREIGCGTVLIRAAPRETNGQPTARSLIEATSGLLL